MSVPSQKGKNDSPTTVEFYTLVGLILEALHTFHLLGSAQGNHEPAALLSREVNDLARK